MHRNENFCMERVWKRRGSTAGRGESLARSRATVTSKQASLDLTFTSDVSRSTPRAAASDHVVAVVASAYAPPSAAASAAARPGSVGPRDVCASVTRHQGHPGVGAVLHVGPPELH